MLLLPLGERYFCSESNDWRRAPNEWRCAASDLEQLASHSLPPTMPSESATVRDVKPADFIAAYAAHLKRTGLIELPKWIDYMKTGFHKELTPYDPDFY